MAWDETVPAEAIPWEGPHRVKFRVGLPGVVKDMLISQGVGKE